MTSSTTSFAFDRSSKLYSISLTSNLLQPSSSTIPTSPPHRHPVLPPPTLPSLSSSHHHHPSSPQELRASLRSSLESLDLTNSFDPKSLSNDDLLLALQTLIASLPILDHHHPHSNQDHQIRSILLVQIILRSYSNLFQLFCLRSYSIKDLIDYWSIIQNDRISSTYYFLQTIPTRALDWLHRTWLRAKRSDDDDDDDDDDDPNRDTSSSPINSISRCARRIYRLLRTDRPPSISISSLFPILRFDPRDPLEPSTAPIRFLSTLSPILLARQEASLKREALESVASDLVERIGRLVNSLKKLEDRVDDPLGSDLALRELVQDMLTLTSPSNSQNDCLGSTIDSLHQLLSNHLENHHREFQARIDSLSPPGLLTRNWPWLVSLPLLSYSISSLALNYRTKILDGMRDAQETLTGFLTGWVIQPIQDILHTLKVGQKGTLAIMTKDSLPSELDSLERMVVDFGRDQLKSTDEELLELSESVKEGNLTSVLRVWEQQIKSPIRSTIAGSLIRVLLIQIQKVKVDLSLAMDGIQSILRSQSLTFGAIGVAPSMLICFMFSKLLGSLIRKRTGMIGKGTKAVRKEVRIAMRRIERTLLLITANPKEDEDHPITRSHTTNPERTLGSLFLDLNLLRSFVHSAHFPRLESSQAARDEFLADIGDLESFRLSWKTKSKLAKRFIKRWGFLVGI